MTSLEEKVIIKKRVGVIIIANSILWGSVIIITSLLLRGTGLMGKFIPVLGGGAVISNFLLSTIFAKKK